MKLSPEIQELNDILQNKQSGDYYNGLINLQLIDADSGHFPHDCEFIKSFEFETERIYNHYDNNTNQAIPLKSRHHKFLVGFRVNAVLDKLKLEVDNLQNRINEINNENTNLKNKEKTCVSLIDDLKNCLSKTEQREKDLNWRLSENKASLTQIEIDLGKIKAAIGELKYKEIIGKQADHKALIF